MPFEKEIYVDEKNELFSMDKVTHDIFTSFRIEVREREGKGKF